MYQKKLSKGMPKANRNSFEAGPADMDQEKDKSPEIESLVEKTQWVNHPGMFQNYPYSNGSGSDKMNQIPDSRPDNGSLDAIDSMAKNAVVVRNIMDLDYQVHEEIQKLKTSMKKLRRFN